MKSARKGLFMSHFLRTSSKLLSHLIFILTTQEYGDDTEEVLSLLLSFCYLPRVGAEDGVQPGGKGKQLKGQLI